MTLSAISSGSEWRGLESLRSKSGRSDPPSEFRTELSTEVDVEGVEAEGEAGTEVDTLTVFALDFFFLAGEQAVKDEARPFSLGALFSFPPCLFSSLWSRRS